MTREEHARRLAELASADRVRRAQAEPEIARKEAALRRETARLAGLDEDNRAMEAEIEALRRDLADDDEG